jgi:hypothetical protein
MRSHGFELATFNASNLIIAKRGRAVIRSFGAYGGQRGLQQRQVAGGAALPVQG